MDKDMKEKIDYNRVLIAHYDTGNVDDPINVLHDSAGKPILENGEKVEGKIDNVKCSVSKTRNPKTWSFFLGTLIFNKDVGIGTLYRTNKRLIYIRDPRPGEHFRSGGILGMPRQGVRGLQAKEWKEKGRKECISIPIRKIVKCKKLQNAAVYVDDKSGKYLLLVELYTNQILENIL